MAAAMNKVNNSAVVTRQPQKQPQNASTVAEADEAGEAVPLTLASATAAGGGGDEEGEQVELICEPSCQSRNKCELVLIHDFVRLSGSPLHT